MDGEKLWIGFLLDKFESSSLKLFYLFTLVFAPKDKIPVAFDALLRHLSFDARDVVGKKLCSWKNEDSFP